MHDRIVDFSDEPVGLSVRYENLVVRRDGKDEVTIPLADVAVVVASHPQVVITQAVLAGLAAAGAVYVVCDANRLPSGMMLPLVGHFAQVERIQTQIGASLPTKKRSWAQVVQCKLRAQGDTLLDLTGDDGGLLDLSKRVRSGDPDNLEAQGARRYWERLFGSAPFTRDRDAEDANRFLNYGYAVLRAITARAVCAAGLHPSIGIHHHNRYSAFTLADDLMEPFRVVVDRSVVDLVDKRGSSAPMDKETKAVLIGALLARFGYEGEARTMFDIVQRVASSLASVCAGESGKLALPAFPGFFISESAT